MHGNAAAPCAGRRGRPCQGRARTLSTRRKKHAELKANIERDAERLEQTGSLPAADKYLPLVYPEMATALDYLPENAIVLIEDTPRLRDAARDFLARIGTT